ncbi:MAG: AAA family ATPase [Burkholderiaceae bacterium]|nr:AAA family ATPase [Burkholderiaceae bacterium]
MYQDYYGLRDLPFELTPNPKFLFLSRRHSEALSNLEYGLSSAKPVTLLIGEAGTGKTTLLRTALESDRCREVRCVYLNNPALTRAEFVETLARRFDLSPRASESKAALLAELEGTLRERRAAGVITALIVDEAQSLTVELLEEVRLLANIETTTEKLLPLVLAGQPELADRLNDPALRQLKQRVALRCDLTTFDLSETASYIATRIRTAGGDASRLFTREAVRLVHEYSRGIPRTISVICDNALVSGMALGRQPVDRAIVAEVSRDFDLHRTEESANILLTPSDETTTSSPEHGVAYVAPAIPSSSPRAIDEEDQPRRAGWFGSAGR